jgi:hypothetical protein
MSLRKFHGGQGRRPVGSRRSTRSLRPSLEGLERREVMTVAFIPALGAETIFWRTNVAGHAANSSLTGPVSNPTALTEPTVYLIFSGSSWTGATAAKYASDANAILASAYLSGLTQYGSSGTATYGGYTIDNRPSPGPSGRDAEIQYALDVLQPSWQKPTGVAPNPTGYLTSPIYVVVDDNGGGHASNGGGLYTSGGTTYLTNGINIDNGTWEDGFTDLFSHELVERISDGTGAGIGMNAPVDAGTDGETKNAQIADNEPDAMNYTYRLNGTIMVQAYWSVVDQMFIVPDGNQQTVILTPRWVNLLFMHSFDLLAVQDTPEDANPTGSVINTQETLLTLGNETFNFDTNSIWNVDVYTLASTYTTGQVWHIGGPNTSWTAITGANTNATQLVTDGSSVYMLTYNGFVDQVWRYDGSGTSWTAITGTNTIVVEIAATDSGLFMLGRNNNGVNQVWQYSGSGTDWAAVTGTNTFVYQIAAAGSELFMSAYNNNDVDQVWQYDGSGTSWTPITGTNTYVVEIAATGSELFMLATNGGSDQVWQYSGSGTDWAAVTGTNTYVSQLVACGDELFMVANNGFVDQVWRYDGSGTSWTAITGTNTTVSYIFTIGTGLFLNADNGNGYENWQYSGSGTNWILV